MFLLFLRSRNIGRFDSHLAVTVLDSLVFFITRAICREISFRQKESIFNFNINVYPVIYNNKLKYYLYITSNHLIYQLVHVRYVLQSPVIKNSFFHARNLDPSNSSALLSSSVVHLTIV